jgi:3-hydroxyacyl-CoA dehydrogenase
VEIRDVAGADVVVEAVWEQMALKQEIFALIDQHAPLHAVLGTNTSTLDIDQIANATKRPGQVVGLHFFSPAHVMPLLEVVRGPRTAPQVLVAARRLGAAMRKTAVVVGICDGFVGNRLMISRDHEADRLLLEGALPQQVDRVLTEFGLPMGTYEIADMAGGIELVHRIRQQKGIHGSIVSRLFEAGRLGQKTGKGYYRYEAGKRRPLPDPEVTALIEAASREAGIERQALSDDTLRRRLILPMINEGAKLIEEGVVDRASDIDMVWQRGFGWPAWKGGPMYHADQLGLQTVLQGLRDLQQQHGDRFRPSALLERMAAARERFTPPAG